MPNRHNWATNALSTPVAAPAPAPAATLPNTAANALSAPQAQAFQAFYNTPVYQFPLEQGLDAINANYAGRGALQSGAAMKAIEQYGANAAAGGLRDWMGYLGNQQSLGATAASGQTGVSANYGNSMAGANSAFANNVSTAFNNYGNAQSQGAINQGNINSNAAVAHANNSNALLSGIGSSFNKIAGNFAYQPYG